MFKDNRYINAGQNEIYRYGKKAQELAKSCLEANEAGYFSIPCDCGKYWTLGTSDGKYGEFIKWHNVFFSVNRGGFAYAKAGTEKGEKFIEMVNDLIAKMDELNQERLNALKAKAEEEDE